MKVFIYPADSIAGGSIQERQVEHVLERKVTYFKPDKYGYKGCNIASVFFTRRQAELAKEHDRMSEEPRQFLIEKSGFSNGERHLTYLIYGPWRQELKTIVQEHKNFWKPVARRLEIKEYFSAFFLSVDYYDSDLDESIRSKAPEILNL